MKKIILASKSLAKLAGTVAAFEKILANEEVRIYGVESKSGVADQPFEADVLMGARNRLKYVEENANAEGSDYIVACEGGIVSVAGVYFNVQYSVVKNLHTGEVRFGVSQGFQIPAQYVERVRNEGLASVMDGIFEGKGGVRVLTNGEYTRQSLVESSVLTAMGGFKW